MPVKNIIPGQKVKKEKLQRTTPLSFGHLPIFKERKWGEPP